MLINSTLTQIVVAATISILCFLSKYFYTKVKEKEINIAIRATRGYHVYRKKMELYTVIFSSLGIILFSYYIYLSVLEAIVDGSWMVAYIKIFAVFIIITVFFKKDFMNMIIIPGTMSILVIVFCNQPIFKDIILKISEKSIFIHMDLWIITYVLIFFTIYFFNLNNKKRNKKNIIFGTIFLFVSIISCCYFYYLMIKSAVDGRGYILTIMQMLLFSSIGIEIYLYKKDKLFSIDYQSGLMLGLMVINSLIYVIAITINYIIQGNISIQVIRVR